MSVQEIQADLDAAYRQMAQDELREAEAWEWAEATMGDAAWVFCDIGR